MHGESDVCSIQTFTETQVYQNQNPAVYNGLDDGENIRRKWTSVI